MNNFIREFMEECGLKQKDLAEIIGVSSAAVSKWNDMREISVENLFSLSKLFHITVDELLAEQRKRESIEDKWNRQYCINEQSARYKYLKKFNLSVAPLVGKSNQEKYVYSLLNGNEMFIDEDIAKYLSAPSSYFL